MGIPVRAGISRSRQNMRPESNPYNRNRAELGCAFLSFYIHGNMDFVLSASKEYAPQRANILIVPTDGCLNVLMSSGFAVCGVQIIPSQPRNVYRYPCMAGIGSLKPGLSGRGIGFNVTAYVPAM